MRERGGLRENMERWLFFMGVAFLILLAGMLIARYKIFPYRLLDDAIKGAGAAAVQIGIIRNTDTGSDASDGERSASTSGVTRHDPQLTLNGYTLFSAGSGQEALL